MSKAKPHGLTRRHSGLMALEPRFMFDGAAVDVAHDQLVDTAPPVDSTPPVGAALFSVHASASDVASAAQLAQQQVRDYLARSTDGQLFDLFNGGKTGPDSQWAERLSSLREELTKGTFSVNVVAMDRASEFTAMAAFTQQGPNGEPTVFINTFWFGMLDAPDAARVLVEELGHAFDAYLNPNADTAGDEGESFADHVLDGGPGKDQNAALLTQNDHGTVMVDGVTYEVEFASLNFINAYEMVYDLDNDTFNDTTVVTSDVDVNERWADKEQNSHYFNASAPLGRTSMTDGTNGQNFSGNDVSGAVSVTIGNATYYGWVSRPIKSNGIVRGFYFWTDANFNLLADAQTDGNQDRGAGDPGSLDNRGFLLVVDQDWFDQQIASTGVVYDGLSGRPAPINNLKDGNDGVITVANVGSSSDRVDAALNSLLAPNSPPVAANDSLTLTEGLSGGGNVLTNDTDINNDSLTVTGFTINNSPGTLGTPYTISGVGSFTLNSNGTYTFTPLPDYSGPVPAITYTVSDGGNVTSTATLSINVTPVNDPPVATNDSVTTSENIPKILTLNDFGTYTDPESDPLAKIQITQLATNGSLQYWNGSTWSAVTLNQELTVAQILQGQLRFAPDANESGSNYATVQFKVSDGQLYSTNPYTLTVNVSAGNVAPVANADTNAVIEAGCSVLAAPATGNVISGGTPDSDANGGTLSVTAITAYGNTQTVAAGSTSSNGAGTVIAGQYGTLTIGANGSYSYALNNSLAAIDAMNSGSTKTEVFNYALSDGQGGAATTTLTFTINGTNDAPIGVDDFAAFQEGSGQTAGNYGTVTVASNGALANDRDVDNSNNQLVVKLVDGTTPPTIPDILLSASSPISAVTLVVTSVSGNWNAIVPTSPAQPVWTNLALTTPAIDKLGNQLTAYRVGTSGATLVFSDNVALYDYENQNLYIKDPGNSNVATISIDITSATTSPSATISTTANVSGISAGYEVTGTGVPAGTTVVSVDSVNKTIVLSNQVNIVNTSLTFRNPSSISVSATQEYMAGNFGYLILNQDGGYTYTLTTDLAANQVVSERFTYTVVDPANGCTGTAAINIRVYGVDAPKLANDRLLVSEDSGAHITFNGAASGSDTVKAGDLNGTNITLGDITSFRVTGDATSYAAGSTANIAGVGTLSIAPDGSINFDPVNGYLGPVPTVTYTRSATGAGADANGYSAQLSITIDPVDNDSVLVADTKTINEDAVAEGNVLANDSDVDSTLTVASFRFLSNGVTVSYSAGTVSREIRDSSNNLIGTITLNTNGAYTFTPTANWNGSIPRVTYTTNTAFDSTLDITVTPVNDPPVLDLDLSGSGTGYSTTYTNAGTAVSIGDVDVNITDIDDANMEGATIVLTNPQTGDVLTVGSLPAGISIGSGPTLSGGVLSLTLTGTANLSAYQDAIKAIAFGSTGTSTVARVISVKVNDGATDSNTAYTTINVSPDSRALTVSGTTVNEASPYVQFQVGGASGQWVSLALGTTGSGTGHATMGVDFLPNLQYFNGINWVDYTGGFVQIPAGSSTLLVRTPVLQDRPYEGAETLKLTAYNQSQWQSGTGTSGNSTIVDDGTGDVYLAGNNSSAPSPSQTSGSPTPGYPNYLDDDRPVTVDNIVVNEASPWAMFTITGYANQVLSLALSNGTATVGDGNPADGTEDYSPVLQYWNGSTWTPYNGTSVTMSGTTLLVRTAVHQDNLFEGQHVFNLGVTKQSSGSTVYGSASIYDDGTGKIYAFDNDNDGTATITSGPGAGFDDDRALSIDSPLVNEGSDYVVFTLTGNSGQTVSLQLQDESNNGTVLGKANIIENQTLKIWDGLAWVNYDANNLPTFDGSGKIFVRVDIIAEQDAPFEGAETFKLNATLTGRNTAVTGVATIIDDGTGVKYTGTFTSGAPTTSTTSLDNDQSPTLTVTGGNYNENSPRAVFTVNASAGQVLTLDVQNAAQSGKAPTGDNEGKPNDSLDTAPIYYSLDGGATWQLYNGPITAGNVPVLVAVDISNERDNVYEGEEQLKLVVTSGGQTASGFSSIFDDGTGTVTANITPQTTNNTGANDPAVVKDDDRPAPALTPPALPPAPSPSAPPVLLTPPPPLAPTVPSFASALTPLAPAIVPADPPGLSMIDAVTSGSGYQIPVSETAPPGLTLYQGITDQFVQTVGAMTKVSLPFDAFIHTNKDAVIKLEAKQVDNSNLPSWVQFDPATGVFEVTPPPNFRGKLDLKVVARDDDGREAVAIFQMFIGEQTQPRAQGRDSFSEKLRMAGKRPVTLVRVADASSARLIQREAPARETVPMRVRAG